MTTESVGANETDVRNWALRTLDISPSEATAAEILRHVTESGYVLPDESIDAVQFLLTPSKGIGSPAMLRGQEQRMETAVTEFAKAFFDIEPDERLLTWAGLKSQCLKVYRLNSWLDRLSPGLQVTRASATNEVDRELIQAACDVFTSKYPEGIRRRQEFISMCRDRPEVWEPALLELKERESYFLRQIAPWISEIRQTTILRPQSDTQSAERAEVQDWVIHVSAGELKQQPILQGSNRKRSRSSQAKSERSAWWLGLVVFIGMLRAIAGRSPAPAPAPIRPPNPPVVSWPASESNFDNLSNFNDQNVDQSFRHDSNSEVPAGNRSFRFSSLSREEIDYLCSKIPELRAILDDPKRLEGLERRVDPRQRFFLSVLKSVHLGKGQKPPLSTLGPLIDELKQLIPTAETFEPASAIDVENAVSEP